MPKKVIKKGFFIVDVYKVAVEIYVMATARDVSLKAKQLHKKFGFDDTGIPKESCGYALTFERDAGTFYIVFSLDSLDVNTITHEADHIRRYIMEYSGLTEADGTGETSANLSGYINEKVFRFLYNNNLKVKQD